MTKMRYEDSLENALAQADALIAQNASKIDPNPRSEWPKGSILEAAVSRHEARASILDSIQKLLGLCKTPNGDTQDQ